MDSGNQAHDGHRQAGEEEHQARRAVNLHQIAAQGADLVQGYEGNQQAVDTLGAGKQLQKQYLGEGAGILNST